MERQYCILTRYEHRPLASGKVALGAQGIQCPNAPTLRSCAAIQTPYLQACVNSQKQNDWTPLMYAATSGCVAICRDLVECKASVEALNKEQVRVMA